MKWVTHLGVSNENERLNNAQNIVDNIKFLQIYNMFLILKSYLKPLQANTIHIYTDYIYLFLNTVNNKGLIQQWICKIIR